MSGAERDPAFERRVLKALDAAIGWPREERAARLKARFGKDEALVAAVSALLDAHDRAGLMPTEPAQPRRVDEEAEEAPPPERVGAYRLAGRIGQGGMGTVWRGERAEGGFEQTAAVKLMRGGLYSAAAAEQFALERRILARLHHPHITQIFDGGVAEGHPYIVMELVQGPALLDLVRDAKLPALRRLELFLKVCSAAGHAHANGVVHADIKPSNVLVDPELGVKVLDFGIAALVGEDQGAGKPRAQTPRYASPQQARGEPPTPADDIHALGVLLGDLTEGLDPDPELSAVIARATAADPADRYSSAGELAEDVERRMSGHPVRARPQSGARTAGFFARRHPIAVGAAGAGLIGLVAALAVITSLYLQAERRYGEVRSLAAYVLQQVTDDLQRLPGTARMRHALADRGRAYLERLAATPWAGTDVRLEAAEGYARMGEALTQPGQLSAGDIRAGRQDLERAERGLRPLMAETGGRADVATVLARTLNAKAANLQNADNKGAEAETVYDEACALAARAMKARPQDPAPAMARLDCLTGRATVIDYEGQYRRMHKAAQAALAAARAMPAGADRANVALHEASALAASGNGIYYQNALGGALDEYRRARDVLQAALAVRPDVRLMVELAFVDYDIASTLDELKRPAEGLPVIDEAVRLTTLLRTFEDSPRARHIQDIVDLQRAVNLASLRRYGEAIAQAEANMAARRASAAAAPDSYDAARAVPVGMKAMAQVYWAAGRRRAACGVYRDDLETWAALKRRGGLNGFDAGDEVKEIQGWVAKCAAMGL